MHTTGPPPPSPTLQLCSRESATGSHLLMLLLGLKSTGLLDVQPNQMTPALLKQQGNVCFFMYCLFPYVSSHVHALEVLVVYSLLTQNLTLLSRQVPVVQPGSTE